MIERAMCNKPGCASRQAFRRELDSAGGGSDWAHVHLPADGHRPLLGTPVDWSRIRQDRADVAERKRLAAGERTADYPPPLVRARPAKAREVPKTAKALAEAAEANGWSTAVLYAKGVPPKSDGSPTYVTVREPLLEEDGTPALSPTGKERYTETETSELRYVDVVLVRAWKREDHETGQRPVRVEATWEDGKFFLARMWSATSQPARLSATGVAQLIRG